MNRPHCSASKARKSARHQRHSPEVKAQFHMSERQSLEDIFCI